MPDKLEKHLLKAVTRAREWCPDHKIVVVYGKKCYVNADEPLKRVDSILQAAGQGIVRVQGAYGYDMLAGLEDRQRAWRAPLLAAVEATRAHVERAVPFAREARLEALRKLRVDIEREGSDLAGALARLWRFIEDESALSREIGRARLEAVPTATQCINCKAKGEEASS